MFTTVSSILFYVFDCMIFLYMFTTVSSILYYVCDYMTFLYTFTTVKHFVTTVCEKRYTNKVYLLTYKRNFIFRETFYLYFLQQTEQFPSQTSQFHL